MPKVPIDYSKTIIYKIVCKDVNIMDCYVGQTTNFNKRKEQHKWDCNSIDSKKYNQYNYQFIRENSGWKNWDIIEVEKFNATDKLDAKKRERYWIETLKASLNKQLPNRSKKEYYEENKEQHQSRMKKYYDEHKEQLNARNKQYWHQYYQQHKKEIYINRKEEQKIYREKNRDKINAQKRLNRKLKKEQLNSNSI